MEVIERGVKKWTEAVVGVTLQMDGGRRVMCYVLVQGGVAV